MIDIIYAALHMRVQTEKTTFSCKDDEGKSLHVNRSGGKGLVEYQDCTFGIFVHFYKILGKPSLSISHKT